MNRSSSVDTDAVARQQNADAKLDVSLKVGCLKLGDDDVRDDINNFELQQRQRFTPS